MPQHSTRAPRATSGIWGRPYEPRSDESRGDRMIALRVAWTIAVLLGMLATTPAAQAQLPGPVRKIGFLSVSPEPQAFAPYPYLEGFRQGLRDRGWIEGQNLVVEYRWASGASTSSRTSRASSTVSAWT